VAASEAALLARWATTGSHPYSRMDSFAPCHLNCWIRTRMNADLADQNTEPMDPRGSTCIRLIRVLFLIGKGESRCRVSHL